MTLLGISAFKASFVRARQVNGVSLGGLITTAHPAARAGATLRLTMAAGKFHGVMIPQTPTGSFSVITMVFGVDDGIVSPYERVASSANQAMKLAA
jgi:hypothetical protein